MWNSLVVWFSEIDPVIAALTATVFTWLVTASGASLVFFFQNTPQRNIGWNVGFYWRSNGCSELFWFAWSCYRSKCW